MQWRIEEDKKGNCFICAVVNFEFERRAKVGFSCFTIFDTWFILTGL